MTDAAHLSAIRARARRLSLTAEAASVASPAVLAATMLEARSDIDDLLSEVGRLYEDKFEAAYEQGKEVGRLMNATRLSAAESRVETLTRDFDAGFVAVRDQRDEARAALAAAEAGVETLQRQVEAQQEMNRKSTADLDAKDDTIRGLRMENELLREPHALYSQRKFAEGIHEALTGQHRPVAGDWAAFTTFCDETLAIAQQAGGALREVRELAEFWIRSGVVSVFESAQELGEMVLSLMGPRSSWERFGEFCDKAEAEVAALRQQLDRIAELYELWHEWKGDSREPVPWSSFFAALARALGKAPALASAVPGKPQPTEEPA
jgi:hypothetical protein